jgi:hypothetical protein
MSSFVRIFSNLANERLVSQKSKQLAINDDNILGACITNLHRTHPFHTKKYTFQGLVKTIVQNLIKSASVPISVDIKMMLLNVYTETNAALGLVADDSTVMTATAYWMFTQFHDADFTHLFDISEDEIEKVINVADWNNPDNTITCGLAQRLIFAARQEDPLHVGAMQQYAMEQAIELLQKLNVKSTTNDLLGKLENSTTELFEIIDSSRYVYINYCAICCIRFILETCTNGATSDSIASLHKQRYKALIKGIVQSTTNYGTKFLDSPVISLFTYAVRDAKEETYLFYGLIVQCLRIFGIVYPSIISKENRTSLQFFIENMEKVADTWPSRQLSRSAEYKRDSFFGRALTRVMAIMYSVDTSRPAVNTPYTIKDVKQAFVNCTNMFASINSA